MKYLISLLFLTSCTTTDLYDPPMEMDVTVQCEYKKDSFGAFNCTFPGNAFCIKERAGDPSTVLCQFTEDPRG